MKAFPVALWQVVCLLVGQWHNQSPIRVTTSFLTRHHNYGHFVTNTGAWWCFHAETFSALLAFCEGILYDHLMFTLLVAWISCWKKSSCRRFGTPRRSSPVFGEDMTASVDASTCPQHIEVETKWPPFSDRHFQMHFREWKCIDFDQLFI